MNNSRNNWCFRCSFTHFNYYISGGIHNLRKVWNFDFSTISFSKIDKNTLSWDRFMHNFDAFHVIFRDEFKYVNCQYRIYATNSYKILPGVEISFRRFLSKIGHSLWKHGTLCFIRSIVHRMVLLAFGMNFDPIMLPIPRLRTLSAFCYVLCLRCWIQRCLTFETTHDNSHLRQPRHIFL